MGRMSRTVACVAAAGLTAFALSWTGVAAAAPSAAPEPVATIPNLTGDSTSVKLDSGFTDALTSLQVTPAPTGDASVEDGVAKFPITGGNVTVFPPGSVDPYVQGMIMHEGSGLSLTKGDTKVTLENFVVDPGNPATLKGKVSAGGETVGESVTLFDLDGSTLQPIQTDADAGTATLTGTTVKLSAAAAEALNGAFSTDALKGGTTVGIATIVVDLPGSGGGEPGDMPMGGVETGGGSTAAGADPALLGAGAGALALAAGVGLLARRRAARQ